MQQRIRKQPFLEIFDGADTNATTGARPLSTTPIQSLFLLNNEFAHRQAARLAVRLQQESSETAAQIERAFHIVLGRPADDSEVADATGYLAQMSRELEAAGIAAAEQPKTALASFVRILASSNEFLFVE